MKKKKALSLLLAATMICACINPVVADASEESGKTTLICANKTDPGTYGPYGPVGGSRLPYTEILFETLVYIPLDKEPQNVMITGYEEVEDSVYDVTLYDYIHDTEGNPVTASDIVFSYQTAQAEGSYAQVLATLANIEAIDDYTVRFTLENERDSDFISMLSSINIVSEAAWEASGDDMQHNCVGTSPYALVDYEEGSYVTYEKTNDYWQTDESLIADCSLANVDTVQWVIIADESSAAVALETGEIQYSMSLASADYNLFVNDDFTAVDGYQVNLCDNNVFFEMVFNCGDSSPCGDENLRKAICSAFDSEAVAANALNGFGRAVGNCVNSAYVDYDESMEHLDTYYPYDPDQAQAYLDDSNYDGETITMLVSGNAFLQAAAVLIQSYLTAVGIKCEIEQYENATFNSILTGESDTAWDIAMVNTQPASPAADMWNSLYFADSSLYSFGNLQHFTDDTYQELYEQMASKETHSTETIQAFLDYTEEHCYLYGLFVAYKVSVGGHDMTSLAVGGAGNINCGGCEMVTD